MDYDEMLYPQYEDKFRKTISSAVFNSLKEEATELLKNRDYAHPDVKKHWESIAEGNVPFGYTVKD